MDLDLDPETEAGRLAALGLVEGGEALARAGDVEGAVAKHAEAQTLDPTLEISADSWNTLCWSGSLWGYAAEVLDACERTVELEQDNGAKRDSRGLARALTGNYAGAIEDFQFYIEWGQDKRPKERLDKRRAWIRELEAGRNPFDSATLEELRNE